MGGKLDVPDPLTGGGTGSLLTFYRLRALMPRIRRNRMRELYLVDARLLSGFRDAALVSVFPSRVINFLEGFLRPGTVSHHDHRPGTRIFQLVEGTAGDRCCHARSQNRVAAVRKTHRALALDNIKGLVRVMAVHIVLFTRRIIVHPRVKAGGIEDIVPPFLLVRKLYHVHDFNRHRMSSLLAGLFRRG